MDIPGEYKQISALEKNQISEEIKQDLVDHWYKAAQSACLAACLLSISTFAFFYKYTNTTFLISWVTGFNLTLLFILFLDYSYKHYKFKMSVQMWEFALSGSVILCSIFWGICIFFNPPDEIHQFFLLALMFIVAACFALAAVGMFRLTVVLVSFCLFPIAIWFLLQHDFYYRLGAAFIFCYAFFLLVMNYRSSVWLVNSLKLKLENAFFTYQANHDLLTDLPNQRLLTVYLEDFIKENKEFAIIGWKVNKVDVFNSSLGYQANDLIMQSLSKRFKHIALEALHLPNKTKFIITHPRSDSFTILLELIKVENLQNEVKHLFQVLDVPFQLGNRIAKLTASMGVSIYPKDGKDAKTLLTNAYAAMFQAEHLGGNQIVFYRKEINEKTPYYLELENDLYHAIDKKQLLVYYQPIIELHTNRIAGMEALIRWQHPKYGLIYPADFISVAEENGLIIPIGEWVLEQAARQATIWHRNGHNTLSLKISVNLSPKQLSQGNILTTIDKILEKTQLDPEYFELELTETAILDQDAAPIIKEISKKGIALSIDDFGTGYSGLSYLKFFDIDKIKIDQSFIQDVTSNSDSATIVSAILAMAKELSIKTLAEGVETKEQLEFLRERNCQYIQGFLFSKAVSADDFTKLLDRNGGFI